MTHISLMKGILVTFGMYVTFPGKLHSHHVPRFSAHSSSEMPAFTYRAVGWLYYANSTASIAGKGKSRLSRYLEALNSLSRISPSKDFSEGTYILNIVCYFISLVLQ